MGSFTVRLLPFERHIDVNRMLTPKVRQSAYRISWWQCWRQDPNGHRLCKCHPGPCHSQRIPM